MKMKDLIKNHHSNVILKRATLSSLLIIRYTAKKLCEDEI